MAGKVQGYIGFASSGRPVTNAYGNLMLFASPENARIAGANSVKSVVKAKRPTKREVEDYLHKEKLYARFPNMRGIDTPKQDLMTDEEMAASHDAIDMAMENGRDRDTLT